MHSVDTFGDKINSPLMRVGSTITTQVSSPGQDFGSMMSASSRRHDMARNSIH